MPENNPPAPVWKDYPEPESFPSEEARAAYRRAKEIIHNAWRQMQAGEKVTDLGGALVKEGLTALPPEIGQLTALTELYLSHNQLTALPPEIGQLTALTVLFLSDNQLAALPPEVGQLKALSVLSLSGNQLTVLPPEVGQLMALTVLDFSGNQLTTLPPEVGQLKALRMLSLSGNQLTALPPEVWQLKTLRVLSLSDNQLTTLPPEVGQLTALRVLSLSDNQLTTLPPEVGQLTALAGLDLSGNQLTALPPEIGQLTALKEAGIITMQRGLLKKLEFSVIKSTVLRLEIGQHTTLKVGGIDAIQQGLRRMLALSYSQLRWLKVRDDSDILSEVLPGLNLAYNQLTALPPEIGQLTALRELDLTGNKLKALPQKLKQLKNLELLRLANNPELLIPDEVLQKSPASILRYYFRLRGEAKAVLEARVILIGHGRAGKTSVVRQLRERLAAREGEETTKDVVIEPWVRSLRGQKVQVHVWDFGGQRQMHAAHPYFFTQRTLYLVVAEAGQDQQQQVDYWLRMVEKYGGGARALVAVNKVEPKGHPMALDRTGLIQRYGKNLPGKVEEAFYAVSCLHGTGVEALREAVDRELANMAQVWTVWPGEWFKVKETVREMRHPQGEAPRWMRRLLGFLPCMRDAAPGGAETMDYAEWRMICREFGVTTEREQEDLLEAMGDLGLVVAFPRESRLRDQGVLNPEWVTRGIYPLLVDPEVSDRGGVLRKEDVARILPERRYPRAKHGWLLELMKQFELAFDDGEALRVSGLLPPDLPEWAQEEAWEGALHLELQYGVLLESVVSRFIARSHRDAREPGTWWRHGMALRLGQCEVLVRGHLTQTKPKVELRLRGPEEGFITALAVVRDRLAEPGDASPPELHVVVGEGCVQAVEVLRTHARSGVRELPMVIAGKSVTVGLEDVLRPLGMWDFNQPIANGYEEQDCQSIQSEGTDEAEDKETEYEEEDAESQPRAIQQRKQVPAWWKSYNAVAGYSGAAAIVAVITAPLPEALGIWWRIMLAVIAGALVAVLVIGFSPATRFRRLFGYVVPAAVGLNYIGTIKVELSGARVEFEGGGIAGAVVTVVVALVTGWLAWLEWDHEKKSKPQQ